MTLMLATYWLRRSLTVFLFGKVVISEEIILVSLLKCLLS